MNIYIVVDLGYGDCGKGKTVDYLASISGDPTNICCVRFSSGPQCGHHVSNEFGEHTFSSIPSGALRGCCSYISEHCCISPPDFCCEHDDLLKMGVSMSSIFVHPLAKVVTPFDVMSGRFEESKNHHGSCGRGVGAAMKRHTESPVKIRAVDLWSPLLAKKMESVEDYYLRQGQNFGDISDRIKDFYSYIDAFKQKVGLFSYLILKGFDTLIFEGSQGILLDMDHGIFPNVTFANTTRKNAMEIIENKLNLKNEIIKICHVTRTYATRHGNGFFPNPPVKINNPETETNKENEWQGPFKLGEIDPKLLRFAGEVDRSYSGGQGYISYLFVNCLDQLADDNVRPIYGDYSRVFTSGSPQTKTIKEL